MQVSKIESSVVTEHQVLSDTLLHAPSQSLDFLI